MQIIKNLHSMTCSGAKLQSVTKHFGQNSKIAYIYNLIDSPHPPFNVVCGNTCAKCSLRATQHSVTKHFGQNSKRAYIYNIMEPPHPPFNIVRGNTCAKCSLPATQHSVTKHFGQNSKRAYIYNIIEPPHPRSMLCVEIPAQNVPCQRPNIV